MVILDLPKLPLQLLGDRHLYNFCNDAFTMNKNCKPWPKWQPWQSVTQHFVTIPAILISRIGGSFPWSISSVMPCKDHHYIPLHERNIPSVDNSLSRDSKTLVFALARVVSYAHQRGILQLGPAPVGALSQSSTRAKLFMECFLKIEEDIPLQPPRGWVIGSGWTE